MSGFPAPADGRAPDHDGWHVAKPCPICDSKKGRCRVTDDGARAMCRYEHEGSVKAVDGGTAWLHVLTDAPSVANGSATRTRKPKTDDGPTPDPAPAEVRHDVYSALLGMASLSERHRRDLERRGLSAEAIDRNGYRSMINRFQSHAAEELAKRFGEDVVLGVPGFIRDRAGKLSMACLPGLLIPVRNASGQVVALKCRPDKKLDDGAKYLYLSSKKHGGPSCGSPCHVPLASAVAAELGRITEGELKADVAEELSRVPTISAPGVDHWKNCLEVAGDLGWKTIRLAFDSDWRENPQVARQLHRCARAILDVGFRLEIESWDEADGKGIDDLLAAGKTPRVVSSDETLAVLSEVAKMVETTASANGKGDGRARLGTSPGTGGGAMNGDEAGDDPVRTLDEQLAYCNRSDVGNAERLVARHGRDMRFCHPWRRWLVWDGRRWAIDNRGTARSRARRTVLEILIEAGTLISDKNLREELIKHYYASEKRERIAAMLHLAEAEEGIPILPDEINTDNWLLNCQNGTIDLRTGKLRPHRRGDNITQLCPIDYDPAAECPLWLATLALFLGRADKAAQAALIDYWQRLCGYALVGVVRDHIMPIAYGTGSNGKSTILGTLMAVLGPDYAMKCPPDLLMAKKTDSHPTDRADLFGKRLVVAIETESGRRLNETMVKELTGGDSIRARRMREDFWEFKPTHTLIMATNHKPVIRGTDHGIWRRLRLVPFTVKVEDSRADKAMPEKLRAEFPGILAWCVRGCLEWQERGLDAPAEVEDATASYRQEQDIIGAFLEEHTCSIANARVKASHLYARYKGWAETSGEHVMTQTLFGLMLQERGIEKGNSNGIIYKGIGLKDAPDPGGGDGSFGRVGTVGSHFEDEQLIPTRGEVQPQESVPTVPTLPTSDSRDNADWEVITL